MSGVPPYLEWLLNHEGMLRGQPSQSPQEQWRRQRMHEQAVRGVPYQQALPKCALPECNASAPLPGPYCAEHQRNLESWLKKEDAR